MSFFRAAARRIQAWRPRRNQVSALVLLLASAALAACDNGQYPQTTFRPVSQFGEILNDVFYNTFWWTMGILVVVIGLILYTVFRYRERPDTPHPKQIHGHTGLEIGWTILPAFIVVAIGIPTVAAIFDTQRRPPEDALVVEVIGHQWWWEFRYPEYDIVTANTMWVPTGRPVSLHMRSVDVIHSFWIPRIGGKRDVNPLPRRAEGVAPKHDNYLLFTVDSVGHYLDQCAEYCGESHAIMRMTVNAVEPGEFDGWVQQIRGQGAQTGGMPAAVDPAAGAAVVQATTAQGRPGGTPSGVPSVTPAQAAGVQPSPVAQSGIGQMPAPTGVGNPFRAPLPDSMLFAEGKRVFEGAACVACHSIAGTSAKGVIGPNLTLFGSRPWIGAGATENSRDELIRWIKDPKSVKPGTLMPGTRTAGGGMPPTGLTDAEVRAVAAYLSSLK